MNAKHVVVFAVLAAVFLTLGCAGKADNPGQGVTVTPTPQADSSQAGQGQGHPLLDQHDARQSATITPTTAPGQSAGNAPAATPTPLSSDSITPSPTPASGGDPLSGLTPADVPAGDGDSVDADVYPEDSLPTPPPFSEP